METRIRLAACSALLFAVAALSWSLTARAEETHPSNPRAPEAPVTRDDGESTNPSTSQPAMGSLALVPLRDANVVVPAIRKVPDVFAIRRLTFETHLGIATPVGEFGLATEYSPHPIIGFGFGAGAGVVARDVNRFHGALLTRLRPFRGKKNALVLGAAYSFGGFQRFAGVRFGESDTPPLADRSNWAHWAQFDVGWERRAPTGFLLRMSVGGAILLNPADLECGPEDAARCIPVTSQALLTLDFAVGYAGPV